MSGDIVENPAPEATRPRGRTKGFVMSQEHRDKIKNSNILNCLLEHVEGNREMGATQVTAGLGLLKKVFPDLQSVAHSGDDGADPIRHVHKIELVAPSVDDNPET